MPYRLVGCHCHRVPGARGGWLALGRRAGHVHVHVNGVLRPYRCGQAPWSSEYAPGFADGSLSPRFEAHRSRRTTMQRFGATRIASVPAIPQVLFPGCSAQLPTTPIPCTASGPSFPSFPFFPQRWLCDHHHRGLLYSLVPLTIAAFTLPLPYLVRQGRDLFLGGLPKSGWAAVGSRPGALAASRLCQPCARCAASASGANATRVAVSPTASGESLYCKQHKPSTCKYSGHVLVCQADCQV